MSRLRVALVCPYNLDRPGGVQSHVRGLARALQECGHDTLIVGPGRGPVGPQEMRVGRFVTLGLSGTRIDLVAASREELANVAAQRFDVVHLHTPWNPLLPLQIWAATPSAAHVATFHDAPPGGLWGALAGRLLMPLAGRLLAGALDAVMAVSRVAAGSLPRGRGRIVPNGIDASAFHATDAPTRQPFILYLGRLEARKGVVDLLEAYAGMVDDFPGLSLVIAGDGPLAPTLRRRAARLPNIRFLGPVDDLEKAALLRRCRVFCAPSRYGESFGIVLLEAMASGAPLVAAANPGYRALLGDDGLLYPPGDIAALRRQLGRLLRDEALATELQRRGLTRAAAYEWSGIVTTVDEVYHRALQDRSQRAEMRRHL